MREQRILKFRAWHKHYKKMFQVVGFDFLIEEGVAFEIPKQGFKFDVLELMQFTGLRDSKGIEIFEGDILKDGAGNVWEMKWGYEGGSGEDEERVLGYDISLLEHCGGNEVIGNLFQNPELLGGGK